MAKMNIYFLINSLGGGGAEKALLTLAERFENSGILLLERDIAYPVDKDKLIFLSSHTNKTNPIYKTLYLPIYAKRLSNVIKDGVVVSFLERANFANVLAKKSSKHKAIISVQIDVIGGCRGFKSLNKFLIRLLHPKADHIVCASEGVKLSLLKLGIPESKMSVIYNPLDVDKINKLSQEAIEEHFLLNRPYIINVGRLTYQKAQWHLIRIFAKLKKKFPELALVILGDGELHDYLLRLSQGLELKACSHKFNNISVDCDVFFLGFKLNPYKYLRGAKLFVFPSLYEGFGRILIEALACGVPVVSADCRSGPREILNPGSPVDFQTQEIEYAPYGILMPVLEGVYLKANDPLTEKEKLWASVLEHTLEDEERLKCYREAGPKRAVDFEVNKIVKEWKRVIYA